MKTWKKRLLIFSVIVIFAFMIGSYILAAAFFGVVMLAGLIFMIEAIRPLKWLMSRSSKIFDIILFAFSVVATLSAGLNVAAALTVAGTGYTLVYGPYLREQLRIKRYEKTKN